MQKKTTALLVSTGVAGLVAGGVLMSGFSANAADDGSSPSTTSGSYGAPAQGESGQPSADGHANGNTDPSRPMRDDEELLTGTAKDKVLAAVKAKYPDAEVQRVETDSDGVYETHLLVDGKPVTVELDTSFAITGTESAPAGQKGGQPGGQEQPPAA